MAIVRDLHANLSFEVALAPQTISTDTATATAIIDMQGKSALEIVFASGTITDGAYAFSIEEGDESDLSDAAAVDAGDLLGATGDMDFAATDDDTVKSIGYIGSKRFVRATLTSTGTTSGGLFSAVAVASPQIRGTT